MDSSVHRVILCKPILFEFILNIYFIIKFIVYPVYVRYIL
jgi:hypothetical protein